MNLVFIMSVILKGVGAVLEVLLQIVITRSIGLGGYGTYSTLVSTADLIYGLLFSGIIKCNTFYLAGGGKNLQSFRKKYYFRYVIPAVILMVLAVVFKKPVYVLIPFITLAELLMYDKSSSMLAEGRYAGSLTGEYILGRIVLLGGILGLHLTGHLTPARMMILYLIQYPVIILFFARYGRKKHQVGYQDVSNQVSLRKWGNYQWADVLQALISQAPVILQYVYSGALEAGVLSVVLLVRNLINFISGPTAKVFLPEFSQLYHEGKTEEIRQFFASIMRIQFLFVSPLAVILIGYPEVILKILARELIPYTHVFIGCSIVFLFAATLGPSGGVLQMTGNEGLDNRCREAAAVIMVAIFVIFRNNSMFAAYGKAAEILVEAFSKFILVCMWMKASPVRPGTYMKWWLLPAAGILLTYVLKLQNSFLMMVFVAGSVFLIQFAGEMRRGEMKKLIEKLRRKKRADG